MKAILQLKSPTAGEDLNLFPGAKQFIAEFIPKISKRTDQLDNC